MRNPFSKCERSSDSDSRRRIDETRIDSVVCAAANDATISIKESSRGFIEPSNCTPEIKMDFFPSLFTSTWEKEIQWEKKKSTSKRCVTRSSRIVNWQNDDWKNENEFQLIQTDIINIANEIVMCYVHSSFDGGDSVRLKKFTQKRVHAVRWQSVNGARARDWPYDVLFWD